MWPQFAVVTLFAELYNDVRRHCLYRGPSRMATLFKMAIKSKGQPKTTLFRWGGGNKAKYCRCMS